MLSGTLKVQRTVTINFKTLIHILSIKYSQVDSFQQAQ